ncbi:glycosyltransferase family 39 protein [Oscillochloris sp. ZM17-4]|uniref:ArnT family glycosyltransferase n=1 Tax=Oscillochloris sp. ZM17-4 TaxID=2866714 RepID=UPI001C72C02E|nr:glycosyltransferase family 39 protein [Oscillochloris sp. ZM17-4]MBX0327841.1 glycosyltransferase family 39 protein [Oscillochloris sp. ZM17-4]
MNTLPEAKGRAWRWRLLVGLIAVGALLLRVLTIRQSLPYVDHPDEPNPINYVIDMLRTGDPNQHFFQKPSLFVYLLLSALSLHYRLGVAAGTYGDLSQMTVTTYVVTTLPGFFVVSRWVSATIGALTTMAAFSLGARGWGRGPGLVGALLVALLPYHLKFSQWATTDVTASFLACLSLGAAILAADTNRWRAFIVAGAFAGLAASAKYNAGLVAGAIVVAAVLAKNDEQSDEKALLSHRFVRQISRLCAAGLSAIVCFVAGTPYALLRFGEVGGGVVRQWGNYSGANGQYRGAWNVGGYVEFFLFEGLSPLLCLAVLAGLILLGRRRPRALAVWLGFALPSLLLHLSRPSHFMQNMLPLLVACALPVGVAVVESGRLGARRGPRAGVAATCVAAAALLLPAALTSATYVGRQAGGDTRVQLIAWIDANVPPGTRIAAELKPVPGPTEQRWTDVPTMATHDLAWYRAQGYAYLVLSSKRWGQLTPPPAYDTLLSAGITAAFGSDNRNDVLGSRLLVIATGLSPADVPLPVSGDLRFGGARLLGVAIGDPSADGAPPMLVPGAPLRPGGVLGLRTFWQVEQPLADDRYIFVHLVDAGGGVPTQRDAPPWQGRFPTSSWRAGTMVVDANDVYLPPGLPPGDYRVVVGMFAPDSFARPPVTLNGEPVPLGEYEVATITVVP